MGGINLEIFKFGLYIMFPIGIMYYFGTNLDNRFTVPDFWPKPEECNRISVYDRKELEEELRFMTARQRKFLQTKVAADRRAAATPEPSLTPGQATASEQHR